MNRLDSKLQPEVSRSTWAIGDVHGCVHTLERTLEEIESQDPGSSFLFVGDLVGKGHFSLETLELVHRLGSELVLGNHDLHLLAVSHGFAKPRVGDHLESVLSCTEWNWRDWLESRPLVHLPVTTSSRPWIMTHAGVHPHWSVDELVRQGELLSKAIRERKWDWYRNTSTTAGYAAEILTRLRTLGPEGDPDGEYTGGLVDIPATNRAWFDFPVISGQTHDTVSGHWAALGYLQRGAHHCIDDGCVYGGSLIALRLEDKQLIRVPRLPEDCADGP